MTTPCERVRRAILPVITVTAFATFAIGRATGFFAHGPKETKRTGYITSLGFYLYLGNVGLSIAIYTGQAISISCRESLNEGCRFFFHMFSEESLVRDTIIPSRLFEILLPNYQRG